MNRPDVRVGSSPNGLAPVSVAERKLGAGPSQWLSLVAIALAAVAALTRQRVIWMGSVLLGLGGSVLFALTALR